MSVSRHGTDWMQKKLFNKVIVFNTEMKIDIKKYLWKPKEPLNRK